MPTYGVHQYTNGDGYTHFQENILANCVIKRSSYLKILGQLFSSIAIKCQWLINYFRKVFILFLCKIEKKKLLKYICYPLACMLKISRLRHARTKPGEQLHPSSHQKSHFYFFFSLGIFFMSNLL